MSETITFIDNIGRNVIGSLVEKTDTVLKVKNPAVINIAQAENGQLQVQIIPLFLAEFLDASVRADGTVWSYNTSTVTVADPFKIDPRLLEQYTRITDGAFAGQPAQSPQQQVPDSVVKLFDE
jgi:hypothetical protein